MKKVYYIENLDCAHCAAQIEAAVKTLPGVLAASVSFMTQKLIITAQGDMSKIEKDIQKIVHKIEPDCQLLKEE